MAAPLSLDTPPRNPREELRARLERAPDEHAEALLAAYEVLQGLHDRGVLELARGALGAGDKLLEILVAAAQAPEAVRAVQNLVILARFLGRLDPAVLESLTAAAAAGLAQAKAGPPSGLWELGRKLAGEDSRRALTALAAATEAAGRGLGPGTGR